MKCVVTGGSGFIGQAIVNRLALEGNEVIVIDIAKPLYGLPRNVRYVEGDIRYKENLKQVFVGANEVYDVAGVLGTHELIVDNQKAIDTNVRGAINVLEVARDCGVQRLFHPTKPNDWLNTYSITKFAAERFCFMYQKEFGLPVTVLKWFNAIGPGQHLYPVRKAVPYFIVMALRNLPIEVFGDGEQTVDLIYVDDIARIAIEATRKFAGRFDKILDVGTGEAITVNQLVKDIKKLTNSRSEVLHLPMRKGEPIRSKIVADVVELKKHLDIEFTDYETGLKKTIEWYARTPDWEVKKALEYFRMNYGLLEPVMSHGEALVSE